MEEGVDREKVKRASDKTWTILGQQAGEQLKPLLGENINIEALQQAGAIAETVHGIEVNTKTTENELKTELRLPLRPPVLCPGCPHRAFYYSLNTVNQFVFCDPKKCNGCVVCEYVCSMEKENTFNPVKSRIRAVRLNTISNIAMTCQKCEDTPCVTACQKDALKQSLENKTILVNDEKCNACGWCIQACEYGAINLHPNTNKVIICDTCEGKPECVQWCPESALSLKGKTTDKIVTGDIGCYTLGFMPPVNTVQSCLCMGGGISQAAGMVHAGDGHIHVSGL